MSAANGTLHITPVEGGAWAVKPHEDAPPSSVHSTEGQAIASVYEQIPEPGQTEVIVHDPEGGIRSSMMIRRYRPAFDRIGARPLLDDLDELAVRTETLRITPSTARLKAGLARRLSVEGADLEADPADLY